MNRRIALALIALSVATGTASAQNGQTARVDSMFAAITGLSPGVAVAVVRNGTIVLSKGYGHADLHAAPAALPQ